MGKLAEIGRFLRPLEAEGKDDETMADLAIAEFERLSAEIGTLVQLRTLGVRKEDFGLLAEKALVDGSMGNNPAQPTVQNVMDVLASVY